MRIVKLWLALALTPCVLSVAIVRATQDNPLLPDAPGKDAVVKLCIDCHAIPTLIRTRGNYTEWSTIVDKMVSNGASGTDAELNAIVAYMSGQFGKPIKINTATAAELQDAFGVTAAEAETLVKYRQAKGTFATWDDVAKVTDVDASRLAAQRKNVVFESGNGIATVTAHQRAPYR